MSYKLEFCLPGLPPMANGSHGSWHAKNSKNKKWKLLVFHAVVNKRPMKPLTTAKLTLIRHSTVCPDPDGLVIGFKPIVDGLVEAGVLENDRMTNIGMPDYKWMKVGHNKGFVSVKVEESAAVEGVLK